MKGRRLHRPDRPIMRVPRSAWQRSLDGLALLMVLVSIVLVVVNWSHRPARIPTHFGLSGAPDAYGARVTVLLLPFLNGGLYLLIALVQRFPHRFNYVVPLTPHNAARQYALARTLLAWLKLEISVLLTYLTWQAIVVGEGRAQGLPGLLVPIVFVVLGVTIVAYLRAARAAS